MKRILLATAAGLILPSLAWAADARLTYQTASGMWADAAVASLTCGVDSSGVPQICDTGGSSSSGSVALRMGDLSASGSSLTLPVGSSGLNLVMSYSASGTGALTAVSASGTLTPVDIYEVSSWGTTSFKGYTLDSGTITTTATSIDGTFYLTSNAVGTYHIGVGGHLYIVDIFGSGAGKRTFMSWKEVY